MNEITLQSYAKLNLALDVLRRRDDGYHELAMIMQSIALCDIVTLTKTDAGISISCDNPRIPIGEKNIAYKAAQTFFAQLGKQFGVNIHIEKNIPSGAGLAGGSANAASVLIGLNELTEFPFSPERLTELGKTVGADVPFCVSAQLANGNFCAISEGIGEILTPITPLDGVIFVLVKPKFPVSTKWAFENLDISKISRRPNIEKIVKALAKRDIAKISKNTANALEGTVTARYTLIEKLKNEMKAAGGKLCLMSGSGSTVFGVFDDKTKAHKAFEHFEQTQDFAWISGF